VQFTKENDFSPGVRFVQVSDVQKHYFQFLHMDFHRKLAQAGTSPDS
jgi:hypothetical protein